MKKYVLFTIGAILSFFGFCAFIALLIDMTTAPEPDMSSLQYAIFIIVFGVLPFIGGTALCIFTSRQWLKKWRNANKLRRENLANGIGEEKPVDPATARSNRVADIVAIFIVIFGIFMVTLFSDSILRGINIPLQWKWPCLLVFIFAVVFGSMLGNKLYKKKLSKPTREISEKLARKMFKDKL